MFKIFFKYEKFKNVLDIFFAILSLIILSPLLILITFLLILTIDKYFIFSQTRVGYKEKRFKIVKFKTMNDKKNNKGLLAEDNERITFIGKFLRNTSLDELPSLYNIAKGDMSFVGPRPLLEEYLQFYTIEELKRHNVKPGLSGLAQIKGRNLVDWKERLDYDVFYVENQSFFLDLMILIKTFVITLKRKGISPRNSEIMPEFKPENK